MSEKSIVGDLINFRGLVYAPINENGVIFLFGKIADDLNMYIEEIKPGFPDCIGRRFIGKGWERVAIEFEYQSKNFLQHDHNPNNCDIIICWEHNWSECPIEVIELKSEIQGLENYPISKPGSSDNYIKDIEVDIDNIISSVHAISKIKEWYTIIFEKISEIDDNIWAKIGKKYIGWYSPERAFVSLQLKKQSIRFEVFSRETPIENTIIANQRFAPRWCKFTVKADVDVDKAVKILIESYNRIKEALKAGEPTGYFSGGDEFGSVKDIIDSEEDIDKSETNSGKGN